MERDEETLATVRSTELEQQAEARVSLLIYHRDGAQMVPLTAGRAVSVGRARPSEIKIRDPKLSRSHARFELKDDAVWVEDLKSTNGTKINGAPIDRGRLHKGDACTIGGVIVSVHILAGAESSLSDIESHDRFLIALEEEVVRARTFGRPISVLMLRVVSGQTLSLWYPQFRRLLRQVDRMAVYGPGSVFVSLPETGAGRAEELARGLVAVAPASLRCGLATLPDASASAEGLIEGARIAAEQATNEQTVRAASAHAPQERGPEEPVIQSPATRVIFDTAERLSKLDLPVLIVGETGTGKEVVAQAIHGGGERADKPLSCINCGAIPGQLISSVLFGHERGAFTGAGSQAKGVFESADNGSVLLDEVGELPLPAQVALLRVLETKRLTRVGGSREIEVDVRILAATHRDLEAMCEAGEFRNDLLFRLNAMTLRIPPLRERKEEIGPLTDLFIERANRANGRQVGSVEPQAAELLGRYRWPGNIRELRNVIERAVMLAQGDEITVEDLSERVRTFKEPEPGAVAESAPAASYDLEGDLRERVQRFEAEQILAALRETGGNQSEAARLLNLPRRTLVRKITTYGLREDLQDEEDPI